MAESISLEETNAIRIKAGLAPLAPQAPGAAGGGEVELDPDQVAEENYRRRREEEAKEKAERETQERIAKAQNRLAINAKLKGQSLGAAGPAEKDDDTLAWIKKSKKQTKELAKQRAEAERREREQEERDREAYGEEDLRGIKVAHDADDFVEGEDVILTLKDGRILDGEEDELQNVNLADDAAVQASKDRKRKAKATYTGYDDEEFDPSRVGERASVLSKYDDEYIGAAGRRDGFRLGAAEGKRRKVGKAEGEDGVEGEYGEVVGEEKKVNRQLLNLDYVKNFEVSDYAAEESGGFKKKKKKVKRSTRRADGDEEALGAGANGDGGDIEMNGSAAPAPKRLDRSAQDNLVDDDDLQMALARQRREKTKIKRVRPEDIAAQVVAAREQEEAEAEQEQADDKNAVTFDDTSEFVRNVTLESLAPVKREPRARSISTAPAEAGPSNGQSNGAARREVVVKIETVEPSEADVKMEDGEESEDDEDEMLAEMALREGLSLEEMRLKIEAAAQVKQEVEDELNISKPEPVVSGGMAGVLALLKQQGTVVAVTAEDKERERIQREKDLWLADHRRRIAKRELERIKARGGNKDQAQREWENKMREQQEAREALAAYANYKPDIDIKYTDEFGRVMTPKEAWKSLSHKFHGKTSGRMKTELRLRRIAEERRTMAGASSDTPSGMLQAFSRRQEKTGEAFMTLSVGNRSSVPMGDQKGKGKAKRG